MTYFKDIRGIQNNGTFDCPNCFSEISPYSNSHELLGHKYGGNHRLKSLTVKCKNCESNINITGFDR